MSELNNKHVGDSYVKSKSLIINVYIVINIIVLSIFILLPSIIVFLEGHKIDSKILIWIFVSLLVFGGNIYTLSLSKKNSFASSVHTNIHNYFKIKKMESEIKIKELESKLK